MLNVLVLLLFTEPMEHLKPSRLAHTYSIVAYDPESGQMGGAVQSHWFSVGSVVIWAQAGVGVVATQSFVRIDYGPLGLEAMAGGETPEAALKRLTAADEGRAVRQLGMVDAKGNSAGYSGENCIDYACDRQGAHFSVQANIMLRDTVCQAMAEAYTRTKGTLAERLMAALKAAQAEGGDLRGKQSSAIKIVSTQRPENPWEGVIMDLRVEDHPEPVTELERLVRVHRAYQYMSDGDVALEHQKIEQAMTLYKEAVHLLPDRMEPLFWQAVNMANLDQLEAALPLFKKVFGNNADWRLICPRLVKVGLLPKDPKVLETILNL